MKSSRQQGQSGAHTRDRSCTQAGPGIGLEPQGAVSCPSPLPSRKAAPRPSRQLGKPHIYFRGVWQKGPTEWEARTCCTGASPLCHPCGTAEAAAQAVDGYRQVRRQLLHTLADPICLQLQACLSAAG